MKRTTNDQVNTKIYWDHVYMDAIRVQEYHTVTNRFPKALEYVKDGDTVMDLGCGVGGFTKLVKEKRSGCEIWGVDISKKVIEQNLVNDPNIKYSHGYIGQLEGIPENYFDVVFSGETLEHLDNPKDLFTDAYKLLKKGGTLIITTPQDDHIESIEHMWYFEKQDIIDLFTNNGFSSPEFIDLPDMEYMLIFFSVGKK